MTNSGEYFDFFKTLAIFTKFEFPNNRLDITKTLIFFESKKKILINVWIFKRFCYFAGNIKDIWANLIEMSYPKLIFSQIIHNRKDILREKLSRKNIGLRKLMWFLIFVSIFEEKSTQKWIWKKAKINLQFFQGLIINSTFGVCGVGGPYISLFLVRVITTT